MGLVQIWAKLAMLFQSVQEKIGEAGPVIPGKAPHYCIGIGMHACDRRGHRDEPLGVISPSPIVLILTITVTVTVTVTLTVTLTLTLTLSLRYTVLYTVVAS